MPKFAASTIKKFFAGALIAGLVGAIVGGVLGYGAGRINELTLSGDDLDNLYVGFEDFAPSGMSTLGGIVSAVVAALAGGVGALVATLRTSMRAGLLAAIVAAVLILLALGVFTSSAGHWHEDQIVLLIGSVIGACVGASSMRFMPS